MFDVGAVKYSFGRRAAQYEDNAYLQRQVRGRCVALAKHYFPGDARVLDAGCGTGALCADAELLNVGWDISGLDIAFGMCRQAGRQGRAAVNADVACMPFAHAQFGGVFSSLMLQWVNDMPAAWAEMARVLKPNGHAVLATLAGGTLAELRDAFAALDDKTHVSDFPPPHSLLEMADLAGFELVLARQDAVVEQHADSVALMRSLQVIGASNKHHNRPRGLMTPSQFARLEQAYRKNADGTLPATWQVLYLVLRKRA